MATVDPSIGGFSFIWNIQHFSYFIQKSESIQSPSFVINTLKEAKWNYIFKQARSKYSLLQPFYLRLLSKGTLHNVNINVAVYVRETNGLFKMVCNKHHTFLENGQDLECFFVNEGNTYLDNEELTLCCRMWMDSSELFHSVRCYASTDINAYTMSYMWKMDNFVMSETRQIPTFKIEIPSISSENCSLEIEVPSPVIDTISIMSSEDSEDEMSPVEDENFLSLTIEQVGTGTLNFFACKISMFDADGKVAVKTRRFYCNSRIRWFNVIPIEELFEKKDLYLPNDTLSLLLEFTHITGAESSEIKRVEYGNKCPNQIKGTDLPPRAWVDNFQRLYSNAKVSDIIVRTSSKEFPAHKAILCAHSPVFSAMFDGDTKENQTGVVEIKDLDDDTLHKLLLFFYTGTVKDLEWEMAAQLYYAADKYAVTELKNECVNFFKLVINVSNVCDILVLADRHEDQNKALESIARDFIFHHKEEVINSNNWKKLREDNPSLTYETIDFIIASGCNGGLPIDLKC